MNILEREEYYSNIADLSDFQFLYECGKDFRHKIYVFLYENEENFKDAGRACAKMRGVEYQGCYGMTAPQINPETGDMLFIILLKIGERLLSGFAHEIQHVFETMKENNLRAREDRELIPLLAGDIFNGFLEFVCDTVSD